MGALAADQAGVEGIPRGVCQRVVLTVGDEAGLGVVAVEVDHVERLVEFRVVEQQRLGLQIAGRWVTHPADAAVDVVAGAEGVGATEAGLPRRDRHGAGQRLVVLVVLAGRDRVPAAGVDPGGLARLTFHHGDAIGELGLVVVPLGELAARGDGRSLVERGLAVQEVVGVRQRLAVAVRGAGEPADGVVFHCRRAGVRVGGAGLPAAQVVAVGPLAAVRTDHRLEQAFAVVAVVGVVVVAAARHAGRIR